MRIAALVKEVPDTYGDRHLDLETGLVDRAGAGQVLDEIGERAVEAAVSFAERHPGTEVIALTMGPPSAQAVIRKAMAMGASDAIQVLDGLLAGADLALTAEVLAAALGKLNVDLVIAGNLSSDGSGGVVPAMIAEHLRIPHATCLTEFDVVDDTLRGSRAADGASVTVEADLPAIISITEAFPDPRYPSFKGIIAAKKKEVTIWSLADLGVTVDTRMPGSIMLKVESVGPRVAGVKLVDDGHAGQKLADFLIERRLV